MSGAHGQELLMALVIPGPWVHRAATYERTALMPRTAGPWLDPPAPTRTWMTARSTPTRTGDQTSLESETSLPHSRTTTPRRPTTTRSQRALAATHRPAPATGPSASVEPPISSPPERVVRAAVPVRLRSGEPADDHQDQAEPEQHLPGRARGRSAACRRTRLLAGPKSVPASSLMNSCRPTDSASGHQQGVGRQHAPR